MALSWRSCADCLMLCGHALPQVFIAALSAVIAGTTVRLIQDSAGVVLGFGPIAGPTTAIWAGCIVSFVMIVQANLVASSIVVFDEDFVWSLTVGSIAGSVMGLHSPSEALIAGVLGGSIAVSWRLALCLGLGVFMSQITGLADHVVLMFVAGAIAGLAVALGWRCSNSSVSSPSTFLMVLRKTIEHSLKVWLTTCVGSALIHIGVFKTSIEAGVRAAAETMFIETSIALQGILIGQFVLVVLPPRYIFIHRCSVGCTACWTGILAGSLTYGQSLLQFPLGTLFAVVDGISILAGPVGMTTNWAWEELAVKSIFGHRWHDREGGEQSLFLGFHLFTQCLALTLCAVIVVACNSPDQDLVTVGAVIWLYSFHCMLVSCISIACLQWVFIKQGCIGT